MKNLRAVVSTSTHYDDAIEQLLAANGQGWARARSSGTSARWWKAPSGRDVGPVTLLVRLVSGSAKHYRAGPTPTNLLVLGSDNITLPFGKFIFHRGEARGDALGRAWARSSRGAKVDVLRTPEAGGRDPHGAMVDVCNARWRYGSRRH